MSARQWKPGDVAMVGGQRVFRHGGEFEWTNDVGSRFNPPVACPLDARPLVVIDPEDGKTLDRVCDALLDHGWSPQPKADTRAALRSLVAPPKPKVYSHIRAHLSPGGVSTSLCGKAWRAGEEDVDVVGQCPNCLDLISEWIS